MNYSAIRITERDFVPWNDALENNSNIIKVPFMIEVKVADGKLTIEDVLRHARLGGDPEELLGKPEATDAKAVVEEKKATVEPVSPMRFRAEDLESMEAYELKVAAKSAGVEIPPGKFNRSKVIELIVNAGKTPDEPRKDFEA